MALDRESVGVTVTAARRWGRLLEGEIPCRTFGRRRCRSPAMRRRGKSWSTTHGLWVSSSTRRRKPWRSATGARGRKSLVGSAATRTCWLSITRKGARVATGRSEERQDVVPRDQEYGVLRASTYGLSGARE